MKTILEHWSSDQDNDSQAAEHKLEQLEFQGRKHVMDARHAVSVAKGNCEAYIAAQKQNANPSYANIIQNIIDVEQKVESAGLAVHRFEQLFGQKGEV